MHATSSVRVAVATTTSTAVTTTTQAPTPRQAHSEGRSSNAVATVVDVTKAVTRTTVATSTPTSRQDSQSVTTTTTPVAVTTDPVTTTTDPVTTTTVPTAARTVSNPSANIAPDPDFLASGACTSSGSGWTCANPCVTSQLTWPAFDDSQACTSYILQAINNARAKLGVAAMVLPSNWYSLSTTQQLFVVANLERTSLGLPAYLGINAVLSASAQRAAASNADPSVASGFAVATDGQGSPAFGGAWSGGFNVLAADYIWMYDDGWGGSAAATSNVACTSAHAAGCWAHRDELLGSDPGYNAGVGLTCADCEMGVGFASLSGSSSFVDLIEKPAGAPPAMTFTWAEELAQA